MNACILFTKIPQAGVSKTRLQPHLTPRQSEELSMCLLADFFKEFSLPKSFDLWLTYTPEGELEKIRHILPADFTLCFAQPVEDLGTRMLFAMDVLFARGYKKVALVGSDIPALKRYHVEDAFQKLDTHDFVFGPTLDGGYYLIAARETPPKTLLRLRTWGNQTVLQRTEAVAQKLECTLAFSETLRDLDTIDDLFALQRITSGHTREFLQSVRL